MGVSVFPIVQKLECFCDIFKGLCGHDGPLSLI
jgi:hypothetical protein